MNKARPLTRTVVALILMAAPAFAANEAICIRSTRGIPMASNSSPSSLPCTSSHGFVFATLEPSVAAYHLAFGPERNLYVTSPTTSSFDHVFRISPPGELASFYRGLGRPQGLAFDVRGNLYVAASVAGQRGVVRLSPDAKPELVISGYGIVGLAFTARRSLVLTTNSSLIELPWDVEGRPLLQ